MKVRNFTILIATALLLSSCSDPYSSIYGESPAMLEKDIRFLEKYKNTLCSIKEKREYEEITRGKCLALYYEYKDKESIQDKKKETVKRIGYILGNPEKFDKDSYDRVSTATTGIVDCNSYINRNCI